MNGDGQKDALRFEAHFYADKPVKSLRLLLFFNFQLKVDIWKFVLFSLSNRFFFFIYFTASHRSDDRIYRRVRSSAEPRGSRDTILRGFGVTAEGTFAQ